MAVFKLLLWFVLGAFGGVLILAGLFAVFLNVAHAQDTIIAQRHNDTIRIRVPPDPNDVLIDTMLIFMGDDGIPVYYSVDQEQRRDVCAEQNEFLRMVKQDVDKRATNHDPEIYADLYKTIEESWCND